MRPLITIYMEDGDGTGYGYCPKCGWDVVGPEIPLDHDGDYYERWLENNEPDYYIGSIISPHHNRLLHLIFECPECKTIFGVQMTP